METTKFDFVREVRTPYSEVYSLFIDDNEDLDGRLDLHYPQNGNVTALLSLFKDYSDEDVQVILDAIDDQIVNTADIDNDNFYVEVNFVSKRNAFGSQKED